MGFVLVCLVQDSHPTVESELEMPIITNTQNGTVSLIDVGEQSIRNRKSLDFANHRKGRNDFVDLELVRQPVISSQLMQSRCGSHLVVFPWYRDVEASICAKSL